MPEILYLVLAGITGVSVLLLLILSRHAIAGLFKSTKKNELESVSITTTRPPPPDLDPNDDKPLPRKLPKFQSFAYYLGSDIDLVLPQIDGQVDLLIISNPSAARLRPAAPEKKSNDPVNPCLGMTNAGVLVIVDENSINPKPDQLDLIATSPSDLDSLRSHTILPKVMETQETKSVIIAVMDFKQLLESGSKSRFDENCHAFIDVTIKADTKLCGVMFTGIEDAVADIPQSKVVSIIISICLGFPTHLYFMEDGGFIFDQVSDYINGVCLKNPTLNPSGKLKIYPYGEETSLFEDFIAKLNKEIALRNDFVTLAVENVSRLPSPELQANFTEWVAGNGFIGWICTDEEYRKVAEVKPSSINLLKGGIPGLLDVSEMDECYQKIEKLGKTIKTPPKYVPDQQEWAKFIERIKFDKQIFAFAPHINEIDGEYWNDAFLSYQYNDFDDSFDPFSVPSLKVFSRSRISTIGQRFIGNHKCIRDQEEQLLSTLSFLQSEGHLRNIADLVSLEIVPDTFSEFENKKIEKPDESFVNLLAVVDKMITAPVPRVKAQFDSQGDEFQSHLYELFDKLQNNEIKIWLGDKKAFGCEMVEDDDMDNYMQARISAKHTGETQYFTIFEKDVDCLHIYVRRDHPSILEAVFYCFFSSLGYSHRQCIALQNVVKWQVSKERDVDPKDFTLSDTVLWQIKNATYGELSEYLMNTFEVISNIRNDAVISQADKKILMDICVKVRSMCRQRLINDVTDYSETKRNTEKLLKNRPYPLENELSVLFGLCTIHSKPRLALLAAVKTLSKNIDILKEEDRDKMFYLCTAFQNGIRRALLKELNMRVMQKIPTPLPEADQMTVRIEMTISRDKVTSVFHLSTNDLGRIIYSVLRSKVVKSEIIDEDTESKEFENADEGAAGVMKRLASGMFFTIPALLDVILILFLGSGVFSSKYMGTDAMDAINLAFLVVFATMGGIMNSIARVCAYYFSQYSIPLMLAAASRRIVGGFLFALFFSIICLIVVAIMHGPVAGIIAFVYCLTFSIFLMFMAVLFVMRIDSQFVVSSAGPRSVALGLCVLLLPAVVVIIFIEVLKLDMPFDVVYFYYAAMLISTIYLIFKFKSVANDWSTWPYQIHVSSIDKIEYLYSLVVKRPVRRDNESITDHGKREKRWAGRARVHFMKMMETEINARKSFSFKLMSLLKKQSVDPNSPQAVVQSRCIQNEKEILLMDWYLMRSGQKRPPNFSFQWDVLLKQAIIDLKKKFSVEKLNRAGLLFEFEAPAIAFGWMYFFMIFIDRWVTLFTGNGIFVFLENSTQDQDYAFGIGWATILMLVCAGTFELNLASISSANASWKSYRLGVNDSSKLITSRKKQKKKFYFVELKRFMCSFLSVFVVTSLFVLGLGMNKTSIAIQYYLVGVFGYFGLLLGLFHKLFLSEKDELVNKCLLFGNAVGLLTGIILVIVLGSPEWAISSLVVGAWIFGISCIFIQRRNLKVHKGVSLAPSLMSSGQNWIGADELAMENEAKEKIMLQAQLIGKVKINPKEIIGATVIEYVEQIIDTYYHVSDLVKVAFPHGKEILETILQEFQSGQIKLYLVIEDALQIDSAQAYSALSEYDVQTNKLKIFVGSPANADGQVMSRLVAEALIHEYLESHGLNHYHSTVSELLLQPDLKVPMRITYQLTKMDHIGLKALKEKFGLSIRREALLLIDISTQWGQVPHELRVYICDFLQEFYYCAHQSAKNGKMVHDRLPDSSKISMTQMQSLMFLISSTSDESIETPEELLKMYIARACLAYEIIVRTNDMAELTLNQINGESMIDKRALLEMTYAEDILLPYGRWISFKIKTFLRLCFMASTADSRFGREIHIGQAFPQFLCFFLPYLYWISKRLHFLFGLRFIWCSKQVKHFLNRSRKGLNREIFYVKNMPAYVKYYDSSSPVTGFIKLIENANENNNNDDDGGGNSSGSSSNKTNKKKGSDLVSMPTTAPFALFHYEGFHETVPKGGPLIESYYVRANGVKQPRLIRQCVLKGLGAPYTTFYHYESTHSKYYPAACFIYAGVFESVNAPSKKDLIGSMCFGKKSGNVVEATLLRKNALKPAKGLQEIEANYTYEDFGIEAPLISVQYSHVLKGWDLLVMYAGGVRGEDMPHISYVDFTDKHGVKSRTHFSYTHPLHPTLQTMKLSTGNVVHRKVKIPTPIIVKDDLFNLINTIPRRSFYHDNLLLTLKMRAHNHGGLIRNKWAQFFSRPATTQRKRVDLWTLWRSGYIEGPHAMDIDELFLREEPILNKYWKYRDHGRKDEANLVIESNLVQISNLVVRDTPNTRTHLQMRISDLMELGCGGDASEIMADEGNEEINSEILQIMCVDSGTWPTGGGGVGSCRRDLIDNLARIRWTAMAEIGTDSEMVQKGYQAERFVSGIHYIPLWGLDLGTPNQHVLSDQPYGDLDLKIQRTTDAVVKKYFVPLVKELIYGCCTVEFKRYHVDLYGEMFVRMHLYFQEFDWLTSWNHEYTRISWYSTWFDMLKHAWTSKRPEYRLLQSEMPTLEELDMLYELLIRLLFPLAARLPRLPVIHASHHGIQALLGVIAKILHGSSLIIWDHGILWRERLLALSSLPPSVMPKFVQIGFVGLTRLAAALTYGHANCICPCTSIQNVQWEGWLGGEKFGDNDLHLSTMRKISPVLNGMDVNRFRVNKSKEAKMPTSVMLSHVNRIKDVMNAIEAAAVIIHEYKLKEYRLLVYGSLESDPVYANECANAIVALNLSENVFLCGLGNPSMVLPEGWVFINSSVSEGLPLAIGEAGLCGLTVVCTDVGGSREVLSDTKPGEPIDPFHTYGRIVPPRSPSDLAYAQIEVMAMLNGCERIVDNKCTKDVTLASLANDPEALLNRMLDPTVRAKRRHLGLLLRSRVYKVFPISRYLRQHEQQMWIAALQCDDWELYQMVQRYVMPRKRVKALLQSQFDITQYDNDTLTEEHLLKKEKMEKKKNAHLEKQAANNAMRAATTAASDALTALTKLASKRSNSIVNVDGQELELTAKASSSRTRDSNKVLNDDEIELVQQDVAKLKKNDQPSSMNRLDNLIASARNSQSSKPAFALNKYDSSPAVHVHDDDFNVDASKDRTHSSHNKLNQRRRTVDDIRIRSAYSHPTVTKSRMGYSIDDFHKEDDKDMNNNDNSNEDNKVNKDNNNDIGDNNNDQGDVGNDLEQRIATTADAEDDDDDDSLIIGNSAEELGGTGTSDIASTQSLEKDEKDGKEKEKEQRKQSIVIRSENIDSDNDNDDDEILS